MIYTPGASDTRSRDRCEKFFLTALAQEDATGGDHIGGPGDDERLR
jgi:hypothetical protein